MLGVSKSSSCINSYTHMHDCRSPICQHDTCYALYVYSAPRLPCVLLSEYYCGTCAACDANWVGLRVDGNAVICATCAASMENGPFTVDEAEQLENDLPLRQAERQAALLLQDFDVSCQMTPIRCCSDRQVSASPRQSRKGNAAELLHELSPYERQRAMNIQLNRQFLAELGLQSFLAGPTMSVAASSAFLEHSRRQVGRKKEKDLLWRDFVDKIAVLTTGETLPMVSS